MTNRRENVDHGRRDILRGAVAGAIAWAGAACSHDRTKNPDKEPLAEEPGVPRAIAPIFVSHGSPMLALDDNDATRFFRTMARSMPRPKAILCASAHWTTFDPAVDAAARPQTIHDFGGFPDALYEMSYDAPGAPDLAKRTNEMLRAAGFASELDDRGLDHGSWIPLKIAYPQADIPVFQVALQPELGAMHHYRLGQALAPLAKEGVLIVGSGSATHAIFERPDGPGTPAWVRTFDDWLVEKVIAGDVDALADYRVRAPHAERNHPTEEHYFPLLFALGAAGAGAKGSVLHRSYDGILSMGMYAFA